MIIKGVYAKPNKTKIITTTEITGTVLKIVMYGETNKAKLFLNPESKPKMIASVADKKIDETSRSNDEAIILSEVTLVTISIKANPIDFDDGNKSGLSTAW